MADINSVLRYCRLDDYADDEGVLAEVECLMAAAEEYLTDAGIVRCEFNAARYDLCLSSLVLHWYDHRDSVGDEAELPRGLRPVINQLKLCGGGVL